LVLALSLAETPSPVLTELNSEPRLPHRKLSLETIKKIILSTLPKYLNAYLIYSICSSDSQELLKFICRPLFSKNLPISTKKSLGTSWIWK
jgi:hypothetical protein